MSITLGIDFGTTNSVVVLADATGATRTLRLGSDGVDDGDTCRTLLCLWHEHAAGHTTLRDAIGQSAIEAYLDDPADSRLIMSMKSYLAQSSFRETRLLGRTMTLEALVARFLAALMRAVGHEPATISATVGRPVRFAGDDPDDRLGEARLRASFAEAGFGHVEVALEPEGAGWRFMQRLDAPATVLVGDFGGGTSDFSVMRFDPGSDRPVVALGHAGVGIAGDQFDSRIIDRVVSPLLGRDSTYRVMGGTPLPVPIGWYTSLSRWHLLSLMRRPQTLREIADVARTGSAPQQLHQLTRLIEEQQGHALYRAVAAAKADLSGADRTVLRFEHDDFRIEQEIARRDFEAWIAPDLARLDDAVGRALEAAGLGPSGIDRVFLTGGTSFVPAVRRLFRQRFGEDCIADGGEFVSVAEGLALIGASRR
ncbi:Hsp70 family protein [Lichenicola sp.]|uniref:Hsp70 family protein n=1 Tax=Lichenicola sp. TaxID=2804529 RepID=UPI003B00B497